MFPSCNLCCSRDSLVKSFPTCQLSFIMYGTILCQNLLIYIFTIALRIFTVSMRELNNNFMKVLMLHYDNRLNVELNLYASELASSSSNLSKSSSIQWFFFSRSNANWYCEEVIRSQQINDAFYVWNEKMFWADDSSLKVSFEAPEWNRYYLIF